MDGLVAGCLHLDSVGVDDLFLSPTRVPFLKIDGIGRRAYPYPLPIGKGVSCRAVGQRDAVMEIDAVALEMGGELLTVVSRCQTARR